MIDQTRLVVPLLLLVIVGHNSHLLITGQAIQTAKDDPWQPLVRTRRMNHGQELELESAPFMARLIKSTGYSRMFCSAAVISPHFLLTAGHCVMDYYRIEVYIGNDTYKVESALLHDKYKFFYEDDAAPPLNDIALIRVRGKIKSFEAASGLALATDRDVPREAAQVQVYGYGFESVDEESTIPYRERPLRTIGERVQSLEECQRAEDYANRDLRSVFCAVAPGGGGACVGDSGGPAILDGKLAGVFSFLYGTYCDTRYGPDLFTRVDEYYQWILENTAEDAVDIRDRAERPSPPDSHQPNAIDGTSTTPNALLPL